MNVVRLEGAAETVRTRRLLPGEEDALMAAATPHLRGLLVAALSTGCRLGELLSLQWRDVHCDAAGRARALVLRAGKTKTGTLRVVLVGQRLAAVLEMLRTDPECATSSVTPTSRPTSRYLRSTTIRPERALRLLEESQETAERTPHMVREGDSRSSATRVLHGAIGAYDVDDELDAETLDAIAVGVVTRVGIERDRPARTG